MGQNSNEVNSWLQLLYEQHKDKLVSLARGMLWHSGLEHSAEDFVQDAFSLAFQRYEGLKTHPNMGGWLRKVVANNVNNGLRTYKTHAHRHVYSLDAEGAPEPADESAEEAFILALDEEISDKPTRIYIRRRLKPPERKLFEELVEKRLNAKELSTLYGLKPTAMGMRITRLRRKVWKILRKYWDEIG